MKSAAIIGCGKARSGQATGKVGWGVAHGHASGYRAAFPDAELYAVDPSPENLAAFAAAYKIPADHCYASSATLYAKIKPDAVSICTWPALHAPLTIEAAQQGVKAITCEKPLALDGFQIQDIISAGQQYGARIAVAHQRRYSPAFVKARELITAGVLGEKLVIEGRVGDDWDVLSWSVHWFDMANYIFDTFPQWALAGIDHTGARRYGQAVENASVILTQYPGTRQALFITGPAPLPNFGITIRGERGMAVVDEGKGTVSVFDKDGLTVHEGPAHEGNDYAVLFKDLWSTVGNSVISRCGIERCAAATQMAYAAHESARTQRKISFPLHTWYAPLEVIQHPPKTPTDKPLSIVLLADDHHVWDGATGRDGLAVALEALGHKVRQIDAARVEPRAADLAGADVLAIYHTQSKASPAIRAALGPWFEAGKPVLVSHCGIGAYADWPEFRKWVGRYWVWGGEPLPPSIHPHVACALRVDDSARFNPGWSAAWLPIDEMYMKLGEAAPVRDLVTATSEADGATMAYAWQPVESPNVVVWLPGHRADMFTLPVVRSGLAAALRLAVRDARHSKR